MNVLLVSQCDKRALTETRRILDQFAERRGERTWQTPITREGLDTLRRLLRKTARKNTAVACHWIRGRDHSELIWIVGDMRRFNTEGAVPTNTTTRDVLRNASENDWHSGEDIQLLAQMAALLHDLGKASVAFQGRLRKPVMEKNLYRHEWVSLRMFAAFVGTDDDETWLRRLAAPTAADDARWTEQGRYWRDGLDDAAPPPFAQLPPLAAAIAWLVVTHHRLPVVPVYDDKNEQRWLGARSPEFAPKQFANILEGITHGWNEIKRAASPEDIARYWDLADILPTAHPKWRSKATQLAARLQTLRRRPDKGAWLDNPYAMHLARLGLMLADHNYSSLTPASPERVKGDGKGHLFANTHSDGTLKQSLDEHLLGVARGAGSIVRSLPGFEHRLPRLARHKGLRKRSETARFRWQDWAADAAENLRRQAAEHGAFIVNMASTGCGKTLANARIMNALAEPHAGMRCTFALGLRTLTMQTGRAYRQDLHLNEDELAVRVGGSASRDLFDYYLEKAEATGSASIQALIEEDGHVLYEGAYADDGLLGKAMSDPAIRSLLSAPMLVCTIDHLMPATESLRAGRQIAPMLRLMSSDLVLDELDDFDLPDLPALARLMHWAGLLGTRVLISSATLPPALVEGMFLAYRAGREHYQRNRGTQISAAASLEIPCLWTDECGASAHSCGSVESFRLHHAGFVQKRVDKLRTAEPRRCAVLLPLQIAARKEADIRREFAKQLQGAIVQAHAAHAENCPTSGKRISFGLVRMANIEPLFDVALELFRLGAPEEHRIHLCVYHSRFPLLLRSAIENRLDTTLNRRKSEAVYTLPEIRNAIDAHPETNHVFVVLASPVCEVGRDWDADWAIAEPSSMRSLIQLAGRVQRHRNKPCTSPNIFVFDTNLRHFETPKDKDNQPAAAFVCPGFEAEGQRVADPFRLTSHRLEKLLRKEEYECITAIPRIQPEPADRREPKTKLVDLEHARLADMMEPADLDAIARPVPRGAKSPRNELNAASAWQYPRAALTGVLPQQQPFRDDSIPEVELVFLPN
ncbi:type I-F CRISPR-associated helicase Cas3f [Pseudolysobacter antarcticus]|uniref:type I-F CRISPR-associated helicase Cas3f n=1 Tax=Pseudolysobacter antarcticus TaxID=2511995 RepID=UPI001F5C99C2|nr:type I-F CRISPR-associated helicase Cas3f [Pseudolysobacter antarcticus]